jgi:hypothetical protein
LFSDDAVALVQQTSWGYPRAVNNLALQALVAAFAAEHSEFHPSSPISLRGNTRGSASDLSRF